MEKLDVEPEEGDADRYTVPRIQRTVPPGVRVEHDGEFGDADDYAFFGRVTHDVAVRACRANGVRVGETAWQTLYSAPMAEPLSSRLEVFREADLVLPDVEVAMIDNVAHLVYGPSVDDDTIQNVNRMLSFMGQLAVSMGDPAEGEWTPVPVDGAALSLSGTTLSVPLSGEPVRALLEAYGVAAASGRYPLWVYIDGHHLGTRMVSSADLDGHRLVEPTTPITLDNRAEAAAMLAAFRHPTRSIVEFGSLCDRFSESVPSG